MVTKTSKMEKNVETILETVIFIKEKVETMEGTLDDHSRDLKVIKKDVETGLDKRLQLEVRVGNIEKHVGIKRPATV
ncbi:hypothetical protein A3C86_00835 [Candidatus Kaiserbacteria bacterium RIFCSPHIGHO2_02_FULL_49_16]|uniref:Uncharacterized protein n=1 Tax=Candidatus Kaiserbacteria bacterium RIFCSPHIGHO2_02_FULL_49_16 TaxID=1798490 RepID=A0A1F6DA21_9BACT|nr:MAG: hypothetical protein A3C86_00835 [Candidatus Kaiserbacteria bacterium RIFCSPHIGHO2_02_FULL_49_16]